MHKNEVVVIPNCFTPLNDEESRAFDIAANRYRAFYVGASFMTPCVPHRLRYKEMEIV